MKKSSSYYASRLQTHIDWDKVSPELHTAFWETGA